MSTALDTNGQNVRYARAADRWGGDPDVLKALIAGLYDPADVGGRYREAAKKIGGLSIRTAHTAEAYFEFPRDIRWTRANAVEVQKLADECDVIHLNNSDHAYRKLRQAKVRKPALLHHHGTLFRNRPEPLLLTARRFHMVQAVSTVDLMRFAPDVLHWLPTAYDLDALAKVRSDNPRIDDGVVRVVSCPTNREIKSTDALEAAVKTLQAEGLPVELEVISGRPWVESLAAKARADIYFDQVKLGYGCNAIEAWAMGVPVVAGADDWTLTKMREVYGSKKLPFAVASEETIADVLRKLVKSPIMRAEYGELGKKHAYRFHAEKPALTRLAELYGMAIAKMRNAPPGFVEEFPKTPGVFVTDAKPNLVVRLASHQVQFVAGRATVENPITAQRLRRAARSQTKYAISEVTEEVA